MKRRNFLITAAGLAAIPGLSQERGERLNPAFRPDPRLEAIFRDLAAPLHIRLMRDPSRTALRGQEADLSRGYVLEITAPRLANSLSASTTDFHQFMSVAMGVQTRSAGYAIRATKAALEGCPAGAPEAFHLRVTDSFCEITTRDADGIRRALIYLEDEMQSRGGPFLPLGPTSRWAVVEDRITRSPVAPYRWLSGWELDHDREYYPDEYLNKLAHCGMNGIWVAGLLSRVVASKTLPELGPDSRQPLEKLKRLTERAGRYGIKVYLFCIEPRALPVDHPAFAAHAEIGGAEARGSRCLCVSSPMVRQYIREVMRELFTEIPDLAGVINIYKGERPTTCWMNEKLVQSCPRCRVRTQVDVLSDDLNCFMEGIRQASATAKFLAWGYSGNSASDFTPLLPRVHQDIIWLGNFEHDGEKTVGGKRVAVREYSLSYVGPAEPFARVTREVVKAGHAVFAIDLCIKNATL